MLRPVHRQERKQVKNIRIRLRWFNLGALATTFLYLWLMSEEEKQKETGRKVYGPNDPVWANTDLSNKMDEIYNNYKDKQNA